MTETKNPGEKTLTVTPTKTLTLKRSVEQGAVRQSFSNGRTKKVVVEKLKRRAVGPGEGKTAEAAPSVALPPATARRGMAVPAVKGGASAAPATAPGAGSKPSGVVLRQLTKEEHSARAHALADAKIRDSEEREVAKELARQRDEREKLDSVERAAAAERKREEEERRRHEEETKQKAETTAK